MPTLREQSTPDRTAGDPCIADSALSSAPVTSTEADPATPAVRRALRALAAGTAPTASESTQASDLSAPASDTARQSMHLESAPATVVDTAHEALADVAAAAEFVADGGLDRLRRATELADENGDRETACAGQRALATVQRYRRAAAGDHFHHGRGTVFRPGGQLTGE